MFLLLLRLFPFVCDDRVVIIYLVFASLTVDGVKIAGSQCSATDNGRCENDPIKLLIPKLANQDSNANSSSIKFIILRNVVKKKKDDDSDSFDEAKLRSEEMLNAEYSEYLTTVQKLEDSDDSPLSYDEIQQYKPYDFQQFTDLWNTGLEVRKKWNDYMYRKFILPAVIQNFLGFLPIQIPGLPYHIDPGSPDEYGYKAINSILDS